MRSAITRRDFLRGSLAAAPLLGLASKLQAQGRKRLPFTLGVITDEISDDLDLALDFIKSYGLHGCELRDIWGKNIMNSKP
ncbi:MAG: twin-arginine translocation signal domain-containing protein, partial [Terriglobia bacterium]